MRRQRRLQTSFVSDIPCAEARHDVQHGGAGVSLGLKDVLGDVADGDGVVIVDVMKRLKLYLADGGLWHWRFRVDDTCRQDNADDSRRQRKSFEGRIIARNTLPGRSSGCHARSITLGQIRLRRYSRKSEGTVLMSHMGRSFCGPKPERSAAWKIPPAAGNRRPSRRSQRQSSRGSVRSAVGLLALASSLASSLALGGSAQAATRNWTGLGGTDRRWTVPANWDAGVPTSLDSAVFDTGSPTPYIVTFPGAVPGDPPMTHEMDELRIRDDSVTFARQVFFSDIAVKSPSTLEGARGFMVGLITMQKAMLINEMPLTAHAATIGSAIGSDGTLRVAQGVTSLTGNSPTDHELIVGNLGMGTVEVAGGSLKLTGDAVLGNHPGSTGTLTVTGPASSAEIQGEGALFGLSVGKRGTGFLNINGGGKVSIGTYVALGETAEGTGTLHLNGAGSRFSCNLLIAGYEGGSCRSRSSMVRNLPLEPPN